MSQLVSHKLEHMNLANESTPTHKSVKFVLICVVPEFGNEAHTHTLVHAMHSAVLIIQHFLPFSVFGHFVWSLWVKLEVFQPSE